MAGLSLSHSRRIIAVALEKAREMDLKPISCVILDAGGHVKAFEREDGSSNMRFEIARGKANAALAVGMGTRSLMKRAEQQPYFVSALNGLAGGNLVPVPGGVLIRTKDGDIVGAMGVTGDTSDNDETCAVAGIEQAGYVPQVD